MFVPGILRSKRKLFAFIHVRNRVCQIFEVLLYFSYLQIAKASRQEKNRNLSNRAVLILQRNS